MSSPESVQLSGGEVLWAWMQGIILTVVPWCRFLKSLDAITPCFPAVVPNTGGLFLYSQENLCVFAFTKPTGHCAEPS